MMSYIGGLIFWPKDCIVRRHSAGQMEIVRLWRGLHAGRTVVNRLLTNRHRNGFRKTVCLDKIRKPFKNILIRPRVTHCLITMAQSNLIFLFFHTTE